MRYLLPLSLLAGCIEPPPDTALAQQQVMADASTLDAPAGAFSPEVVDTAGRASRGARVGPELVLVSSRVLGAGPVGSTLDLDSGLGPAGWYVNADPGGAMLLVQRDSRDSQLFHPTVAIDDRPAGASFGSVWCGPVDTDNLPVSATSSTAATVTASTWLPDAAIGAPCWTSDRVLLGFVERTSQAGTTIVRAAPLIGWIERMNELASVRIDARAGGRGVAGPYAVYVAPAADPSRRMCMDVPGNAIAAQTGVNQWPCHHGKNQQFFVDTRLDAARPRLISNQSGLCLDVRGAATTSGAALQQYGCHASANQRFARESPPIISLPPRQRYRPQHVAGMCLAARSGLDAFVGGLSIRQLTCAATMAAHELWSLQAVAPS